MKTLLNEMRVAMLVEDGFDHDDIAVVRDTLEKAGLTVHIISKNFPDVKGFNENLGETRIKVDLPPEVVDCSRYDALFIPNGQRHAAALCKNTYVKTVNSFYMNGTLIASIGWGVLPLADLRAINLLPDEVEGLITGKTPSTIITSEKLLYAPDKSGTVNLAEQLVKTLENNFSHHNHSSHHSH